MATKKKVVKKPKAKFIEAAILTQDQLIGLAAMISEGTAFLLGVNQTLTQLTKDERDTINGWFVENAESLKFVQTGGASYLLNIISRITGEKFGQVKNEPLGTGANTASA